MATKKAASQSEKPKRASKKVTKDNGTLSSFLSSNVFSIGGLSSHAISSTSPSTRQKAVKSTRKTTCTDQTTKLDSTTASPAVRKATKRENISSAKKSSQTVSEVNGGDANGRTEPEEHTPTSSLHDVKILMDENSQLALLQLRESFKELLEPLMSLRELNEKIDDLKTEIHNIEENVRNLRNMLDDGLEEVKQSIRHAQISK